jgi:hypothetical protein
MKLKKLKFKDLVFTYDRTTKLLHGRAELSNKYTISVVTQLNKDSRFGGVYGNLPELAFEVAVFKNDNMIQLTEYDDVLGWQTPKQITKLMKKYQGGK